MTVTGPQKLNALHKQHLVYLGNTMFNADPPLDMSKHNKQQLYDIVANAMLELQECTFCPDGNCSADTHVFQDAHILILFQITKLQVSSFQHFFSKV